MDVDKIQLKLDDHAHQRYCERVTPISGADLLAMVETDLREDYRFTKGWLHTGGVWWRASLDVDVLTLHTCFGRTTLDIPTALRWARLHNDRIVLAECLNTD